MTDAIGNASTRGHADVVKWLAYDVMKLSRSEATGWLLAAAASSNNDDSTVEQLIKESKATYDVCDDALNKALRSACWNGRLDIVQWLMTNTAADVDSPGIMWTWYGEMTSLTAACSGGYTSVATYIVQCVKDDTINTVCSDSGDTALHLTIWCKTGDNTQLHDASERGDLDVVHRLMYECSNVDTQNNEGHTPLHLATLFGHVEVVRSLLSITAQTVITDNNGLTPVNSADKYGNGELIPYLEFHVNDVTDTAYDRVLATVSSDV